MFFVLTTNINITSKKKIKSTAWHFQWWYRTVHIHFLTQNLPSTPQQ